MQELIIAEKKYQVIELPGRPKALLDRVVAEIYQVETKHINQAVSRNPEKFPAGFCFELTEEEKKELVTNCDRFENLKHSTVPPKAFTWEGCNMLATILKSDVATNRAIEIVRGFTALEKAMSSEDSPENHPLMVSARQLMAITERYVKVEFEQKRLAQVQNEQAYQICELQAKTSAYLDKTGFYSILAYANVIGVKVTRSQASSLGKKATAMSRAQDAATGIVLDDRWGYVKTYHRSILDQLFQSN